MKKHDTIAIATRVKKDAYKELVVFAKKDDRTVSYVMRKIIMSYLNGQK